MLEACGGGGSGTTATGATGTGATGADTTTSAKAPTLGSAGMVAVNPKGIKKLDSRTVRVQMTIPQTTWKEQLSVPFFFPVVPVGYDPKKPIGAGAFKLDSFTPGQRTEMSRFDG